MAELAEVADGLTGCGEVAGKGWVFICLELRCDKFNFRPTYGSEEKDLTKHDAVAGLVTRSLVTV